MRSSLITFADKLNEIIPIIVKEFARRQADELFRGKITLPQFFILEFLHRENESKMTTLAHFMGVTTAAMTGLVDRLVRDNYVVRTFDYQDRRIIKIKLTPKGIALVKKINHQRRKMILKIFGRLSESERKDYLRILLRIKDILTQKTIP